MSVVDAQDAISCSYILSERSPVSWPLSCPQEDIWLTKSQNSLVRDTFIQRHSSLRFITVYAKAGSTVLSGFLLTDGSSHFWFADQEALKIVVSDRHVYRKETEAVSLCVSFVVFMVFMFSQV